METIKTIVVVTCLLGVLYCVYAVLNKRGNDPPPEVAAALEDGMPEVNIDFGGPEFDGATIDTDMGFAPPATDAGLSIPDVNAYPSPGESVEPPLPAVPPFDPNASGTDAISPPDTTVTAPSMPSIPPLGDAMASTTATTTPPPIDPSPVVPVQPALSGPLNPAADGATTNLIPQDVVDSGPSLSPSAPAIEPAPALTEAPPVDPSLSAIDSVAEPTVTPNVPTTNLATQGTEAPESPSVETPNDDGLSPFERAKRTAKAQIDAKQYRQALFTLSLFYDDPKVTPEERKQLLDLLDPLAGRVIYSREHLLTSAHVTTQGETVESIAAKYQIPAQLLININGIQRPDAMTSGTELKVVPGPFRGEIDTQKGEITLFVQRMYAGRFRITVGNDPTPRPGDYSVKEKMPGQTFYTEGGTAIAAQAPTNPYGKHWLNLGGITLHGSPELPSDETHGCVSLSPKDAADVYNILTVGSKVVVRR